MRLRNRNKNRRHLKSRKQIEKLLKHTVKEGLAELTDHEVQIYAKELQDPMWKV